jgi:putative ABC transport system permease protein
VLLRPLPYPAPERIVEIARSGQGFVMFGRVLEVRPLALRNAAAFSAIGLYAPGGANLGGEPAIRVPAAAVSPGFFDVLAAAPLLGRTFTDADIAASERQVVLSDRLWRERFARDPAIVGRSVTIDGLSFVVLGVMPPGVAFPGGTRLWVPATAGNSVMGPLPIVKVIARTRGDVALASVRDRVIAAAGLSDRTAARVNVTPLREASVGAVWPIATLVWIGAALVLLVACTNAANLLLARVSGRHREFAVRRALGATRGQLMRQVVLESVVLSAIGGIVAVPAAWWTVEAARLLLPATLHGVSDIGLDLRFVAATAGLSAMVAFLFGLGPAISIPAAASTDAPRASAGAGGDRFWTRLRSVLIVGQIALALILLAAATALVQAMRDFMRIDIGARGEHALAIEVALPSSRYASPQARQDWFARIDDALRGVPGVQEVGASNQLPGRAPDRLVVHPVAVAGPVAPDRPKDALLMNASPGFFAASGIELLAGRPFSDADQPGAPPVAIVSEGFARALGVRPADLIGARLAESTRDDAAAETIVGVVGDVRLNGPEGPFETSLYVPYAVTPARSGPTFVVVRAARDPLALAPAIRSAVAAIDPDLPLYNVRTFDQIRTALVAERRLAMLTMVVFAALAIALSAVGVYGVVSYLVQQRTREIGIRLAIGATRWDVCRDVLRSGAAHALAGIVLGGVSAWATSHLASSQVQELGRLTPDVIGALALGVAAVALAATAMPAVRAARIDPSLTLRAE